MPKIVKCLKFKNGNDLKCKLFRLNIFHAILIDEVFLSSILFRSSKLIDREIPIVKLVFKIVKPFTSAIRTIITF